METLRQAEVRADWTGNDPCCISAAMIATCYFHYLTLTQPCTAILKTAKLYYIAINPDLKQISGGNRKLSMTSL